MPTSGRDAAPGVIKRRRSRREVVRAMLAVPIGVAFGTVARVAAASKIGPGDGSTGASARRVGPGIVSGEGRSTNSRAAQVVTVETIVGDQTLPGRFKEPRGLTGP